MLYIKMSFKRKNNDKSLIVSSSEQSYIDDIRSQSENDDRQIQSNNLSFSSNCDTINARDYNYDLKRFQRRSFDNCISRTQQNPINPLDLLHLKETQKINHNDKIIKYQLDDNKYLDYKVPMILFEELRLMSMKISTSIEYNSVVPSALAVSTNLMLIGYTNGQIVVFNTQGQEISVLDPKKGLGQVTCIDITSNEEYAIAGYHFGQIYLWDIIKGKCKKSSNTIHQKAIVSIKFWKGEESHIISGDLLGRVVLSEFHDGLLSISINSIELFKDLVGTVLSIDPLKSNPEWPHPTDSHKIIAIAGFKKILIYTLEPEVQKLFSIERPANVSEAICPFISWKLATTPEDPSAIHYILAIAWGNRISLYTFKFVAFEGIQFSGYLDTDAEIKAIFWLSDDILAVVNISKEIQIVCSSNFNTELEVSKKQAIKEEINAYCNLTSQSFIKIGNKDVLIYHNTIKSDNQILFLLGTKEFHKGQLLNWNECIQELNNKSDWFGALSIGLNLYQNKGNKLYAAPHDRKEMKPILQDFAYQFCKIALLPWDSKISASLEYCTGIESIDYFFDCLFDYFFDHANSQDYMQTLMGSIEVYILLGKIKNIPINTLGKMIGFYLNTNQYNNIEQVIIHLEPSCIDPSYVLPACEEHNLLTAYIFIHTNSIKQSFVNPLKKIYKTMTKQKDFKPKLYFTYKLLWYFRLCLQGETFPSGKILLEMMDSVILGICKWLIKRKHLLNLMQMDSVATLNLLWLIFEGKKVADVINKNKEEGLSYLDIVNKLHTICSPEAFLYHQCSLFILKTVSLAHIMLTKEIYLEIAKYIMTNTIHDSECFAKGKDIEEYIIHYSKLLDKNIFFIELSIEEEGSLLLNMLKKIEMDSKELEEIYVIVKNTPYIELHIYLLELKKEYSICIRFFIKCTSLEIKKKVFTWLNETFKILNEHEKLLLKADLLDNIQSKNFNGVNELITILNELVEIDSNQTARFITKWFDNDHLEIVRRLDNAPKLQMKYLGELVKEKIDEDIIFKYVVLLCQYAPDKVKLFLEYREDYNLDECLKECLKYQIVEACAFLHEKLGNIKDALVLLLNRSEKNKREYLNNTKNLDFIQFIEIDIKESILICSRNASRLDSTEIDEYFFTVLKATLQLYIDLKDFFPLNPTLEAKIHILIKDSLEHMMSFIDFDKIIAFIIEKYNKVPFKHFRESIFQILSKNSHQKSIVRRAIDLLRTDVKALNNHVYGYQNKGVAAQQVCMNCYLTLSNEDKEKIAIFICGHGFHRKCIKNGICNACAIQNNKKGRGIMLSSHK